MHKIIYGFDGHQKKSYELYDFGQWPTDPWAVLYLCCDVTVETSRGWFSPFHVKELITSLDHGHVKVELFIKRA
ncbi:hypothetical protein RIF29_17166 [Crotalaria pallida]|uniref:Uncharacterized protein n=1 Tax=Crotalaria pallida TaxID=3830 RepID=A0AAN9FHQ5_CROPI